MSPAAQNPVGDAHTGEPGPVAGAERVESWAGEVRVNLVRLAALIAFYGYHLLNVFLSRDDPTLTGTFHLAVTALAMVWSVGVVVLYLCLSRRWLPPALKYVVTAWDLVLVTTLLVLAGPRSPLVILYFLVIIAAAPRLSLGLVYLATLGSVAAYAFLLAHYAFYVIGSERYYATPDLRVPRTQEAVFVLGLLAAGVLTGQAVRQARRLVRGYPAGTPGAKLPPDSEVRWDNRAVGAGLVVMAVLVGLGLLLAFTRDWPQGRGSPALPVTLALVAVFLVAVVTTVTEAIKPPDRAAQGLERLLARPVGGPAGTAPGEEGHR